MPDSIRHKNLLVLNQPWIREELTALGYNIVTAGFGRKRGCDIVLPDEGTSIQNVIAELPFIPDRVLVFDDSSTLKISGFESLDIPSIFYSVDTHHHSRWHRYFASLNDLTLVAQRQHIPEIKERAKNVEWFPLWPLKMPIPAEKRERKAVFRGNLDPSLHPEREKFFSSLGKLVEIDASIGDWAEPYSKALIVINQAVSRDLNFRCFEALAGGALLLTPRLANGFSELFSDGEDFVSYTPGDVQDLADKINYYFEHESEALEIAKRGRSKLLENHSNAARAKQLSQYLENLTLTEKKNRNVSALICLMPTILGYLAGGRGGEAANYISESIRLMNQAIYEGESLSDGYPNAAALTVLLMLVECKEFLKLENVGRRLLDTESIDPLIGTIFVIHALKNQQKHDEATELGKKHSDKPKELIASVPVLLEQVRVSIRETISKI